MGPLRFILMLFLCFPVLAAIPDLEGFLFQNGCHIFNLGGKYLKSYPGSDCLFLDDGSFISSDFKSVRLLSPTLETRWELTGHFHHQMSLTHDKKHLLLLSSAVTGTGDDKFREDLILVVSLDGKILHKKLISEFVLPVMPLLSVSFPSSVGLPFPGVTRENSHFNSISEVPVQKSVSLFSEGDIVINSIGLGTYVLSGDLKLRKHHFLHRGSKGHQVHDVKVNTKGNFLLFNNVLADSALIQSAIQEVSPVNGNILFDYRGGGVIPFYSHAGGGVQELGEGHILFSDYLNGTFIVEKKSGTVIRNTSGTHFVPVRGILPAQNVRAVNLSNFFSAGKKP